MHETGYCWLVAVEPGSVEEARVALGAWPSARGLVGAPSSWFVGTAELMRVCVEESGGDFHCRMLSPLDAVVHGLNMRPTFAGALASLALTAGCAAGTLGDRLVREHPAVRIPEADVARCEVVRFGGETSRFVRPEFPVGGDSAALVQYYRALNGYNVGLLVELLTSEVPAQSLEWLATEAVECGEGTSGSGPARPGVGEAGVGSGAGGPGPSRASVGLPRGPNYLRNQAARMRKKVQKEERKLAEAEARGRASGGFFSGCSDETQVRLRETRAKLLILENERRAVEEQRKLDKLKSPVALIKDAMELVTMAERYAVKAGDSKVAGWAATLSESYAESVARSAPSSVPSLDSVSSARSAIVRKAAQRRKAADDEVPLNGPEAAAVDTGVLSRAAVLKARSKAGRQLVCEDFTRKDAPFELSLIQVRAIRRAAAIEAGDL